MSNEQTVHAGGRPRLSSDEVQKRREEAYRLSLLGFSQREIGEALKISQGAVSQAIEAVKRGSAWAAKTAKERSVELNRQCYDLAMFTIHESARLLFSPASDANVKVAALGRIQHGCLLLSRLAPSEEMIALTEQGTWINAELDRIVEELSKEQEEKKMQNRVQPMPTPSSQRPW